MLKQLKLGAKDEKISEVRSKLGPIDFNGLFCQDDEKPEHTVLSIEKITGMQEPIINTKEKRNQPLKAI